MAYTQPRLPGHGNAKCATMKRFLLVLGSLIAVTVGRGLDTSAQIANPQQVEVAQKAAQQIIDALGHQKYKAVWDEYTSEWFRNKVTEDSFLSGMSMGRAPLGIIQQSSLVATDHTTSDPVSHYQGDIYAFTFRDKYSVGEFYERIVVIKDRDGQYRLSGLFGAPVPSD